jgi:hypothetical protein
MLVPNPTLLNCNLVVCKFSGEVNLRKMPERHMTDHCPLEVKRFLLTMNSSDVGMT